MEVQGVDSVFVELQTEVQGVGLVQLVDSRERYGQSLDNCSTVERRDLSLC
jgi:hypothetical protein